MRLDVYLSDSGLCSSRTDAKSFIVGGAVTVNGRVVTKPSLSVEDGDSVKVNTDFKRFVSRGGIKLDAALLEFGVSVEGKRCIDVGASSGGFTDCLLQHGACEVIAVDSGSGQLAEALRADGRVTVIENYNARYMKREDFGFSPEIAVMDVSFISATYIIPSLSELLSDGAEFICLIKPQFEVGREKLGKGGIVKDDKYRREACDKVIGCAQSFGFKHIRTVKSPIQGGDGNVEFLSYFRRCVNEKGYNNTEFQ